MSMIERVARALCAATLGTGNVDEHFTPADRLAAQIWKAQARAAIAAMRDPTESMTDASELWNAREIYQGMIDAALNEEKGAATARP